MSKYRDEESLAWEDTPRFEDVEILERLQKAKKLTDRQREALRRLLQFYYER